MEQIGEYLTPIQIDALFPWWTKITVKLNFQTETTSQNIRIFKNHHNCILIETC